MPHVSSYDQAKALWAEWTTARTTQPGDAPLHVLRQVFRKHGSFLAQRDLDSAFHGTGAAEDLTPERFIDCIVPLLGTQALRARHAFGYLEPDATGHVAVASLLSVVRAFAPDDPRCELIASEIDLDGDTWITLDDVISYLPSATHTGTQHYRATHVNPARLGTASDTTLPPVEPSKVMTETETEGMSRLQLRIGFFRLVQGAAYRSFRENYSANSETHLRARDLPYTMPDFAVFLREAVSFYLALGIVKGPACIAEFQKLVRLVDDAVAALHHRVGNWPAVPMTDGMRAAQAIIDAERAALTDHRTLFASVIEFILALRTQGIAPDAISPDALAAHEINRLRHADLQMETHRSDPGQISDVGNYHDSWSRVILDTKDERVDGAIMPVAFWYDAFMPQLLRCASIMTDADLARIDSQTESDLDAWHADLAGTGAFDLHATDLRDGFGTCTLPQKIGLAQAWALTEHYLNGLEKRREREDFGRETGFLSEYVAFIDVFLGRDDVAASDMRLSFPYYIGPAVWCLLHTSAEIVEALPAEARANAIAQFKRFFRAFATMYPCPYCRYHLNRFVIQNREVESYPVEYLLLGRSKREQGLHITLEDKLGTISADAPGSLRLFLWKLHNAVSSSIARTEPWYHRDTRALYTTRFWPSLDAELARAHALGDAAIAVDRLTDIYRIVKPAAALAVLRDELQIALHRDDAEAMQDIETRATDAITTLEDAVMSSGYLERRYTFNPLKKDAAPHFTDEEEAFARSGLYVEG